MKKILTIFFLTMVLFLVACVEPPKNEPIEEDIYYTVTFNAQGGSSVASQSVKEGSVANLPEEPTKDGYLFLYWYLTDEAEEFSFDTAITANITLNALWEEEADPVVVPTVEEKIQEDIDAVLASLYVNQRELNTVARGPVHNSIITWTSSNPYVTSSGIILPLLPGDEMQDDVVINARFRLEGVNVNTTFDVDLYYTDEVVLKDKRVVPFENLTEEYDVEDADVELLFEEGGSVPYIRVVDFFNLLEGFIDPAYEITYNTGETSIYIQYDYYDEEEDHTYDLNLTIDSVEDTFTAPDPGFYWAYVYSTATNFGRHIEYDRENPLSSYTPGIDVVYDLKQYNMDVVMYEGDVVVPYYIANQLFAGSSYYNVYYNYDGLYGIYALPSEGEDAYETIRNASVNKGSIPADLAIHTFNFLAFSMDNFYGLQDIMEVESYYDQLLEISSSIVTKSPSRMDAAIADFLVKGIDEPHTSYGYPGYFNDPSYHGPTLNSLSMYGPRFRNWYNAGLVATDAAIKAKWDIQQSGFASNHPNRQLFWFLDEAKTSVVLSLDSFSTSDITEDVLWNAGHVDSVIKADGSKFPVPNQGTKYFYYNESTTKENKLEVLIKGLTLTDATSYEAALVGLGFVKVGLNYELVDGANTYYAQVKYSSDYDALVLSYAVKPTMDEKPVFVATVFDLIESDSAVYMEFQMDRILKASPLLENIILDITWNTGGNVGALYRVVGFITSDSFAVSSMNGATKSESTSFVYIDGVPTYDHLNWALLITPTSFSAANSLATIFQDNDLGPIIGITSGGGASSITPILLPNGTAFTMSSNNINAYRTGSGTEEDPYVYVSNEFGISPTHPIAMENIYDNETLLGILDSVYA